jgi:tyrosine-protein phosphatase SIW14
MRTLLFILVLALSVLTVAGGRLLSAGREQPAPSIPQFQQVTPELFRGGQPAPEGFGFLKWRGIRTVINLREEHDERELVEKLGMNYVYIPLDAWDRVPDQAIKRFFNVVNDPASQPVFVHCRRGADRTGFMIGLYRIAEQGWSARQAYGEARALGLRWWYRGLKHQLYDFAERSAVLGSPASPQAGRR